jgi:hypothetical protein
MCSKKWYVKRNLSCDTHLLNELLETDVPWDDATVVSAGKLRKLWDSLSELRSSMCEKRLERTVLRPALLSIKTAQFTQFFRQVWRHTIKSLFNWQCIAPLRWAPNLTDCTVRRSRTAVSAVHCWLCHAAIKYKINCPWRRNAIKINHINAISMEQQGNCFLFQPTNAQTYITYNTIFLSIMYTPTCFDIYTTATQ